jgi:ABC-2 type transport system ATP-binding protein
VLERIPPALATYQLALADNGNELVYTYDAHSDQSGITALLKDLTGAGIPFKDLHTTQSSLEDIFVSLVHNRS